MTVHSYNPEVVSKAALPLLARSKGTCQCAEHKSNVPNQRISILDSYRIHLYVIDAESLGTIFFVTSTSGKNHGLFDFLTMPRCNKSSTCLSISTLFASEVRRGCCLIRPSFPKTIYLAQIGRIHLCVDATLLQPPDFLRRSTVLSYAANVH